MTTRYTVRVTWAEVVQRTADVHVHANKAIDAQAMAESLIRNADMSRRAINSVVTHKEPVDADGAMIVTTDVGPGRRDHHEATE